MLEEYNRPMSGHCIVAATQHAELPALNINLYKVYALSKNNIIKTLDINFDYFNFIMCGEIILLTQS